MLRLQGTRRDYVLRTAVVGLEVGRMVGSGSLNMLLLERGRRYVRLAHCHPLLGSRIVPDSAGTTAVRDVVVIDDRSITDNRLITIGVPNNSVVHMHHRGVVSEVVAAPLPTDKADSHVAEAVVDAAVVSHMPAPVAFVKDIQTA